MHAIRINAPPMGTAMVPTSGSVRRIVVCRTKGSRGRFSAEGVCLTHIYPHERRNQRLTVWKLDLYLANPPYAWTGKPVIAIVAIPRRV